jgi:signal transduction histidine kinase
VRLGEMAAVIAHEVKNPLAGIRGAVQVIGGRLPQGSRESAVVGEIISRVDTLAGLIQDLLLFARPPQPRPMAVDVSPILSGTAELVNSDPALSAVRIEISGSAPPIAADAELLKIVFLNLMVNSAHAMKGEGRIQVGVHVRDGFARVVVSDTGPGIPPEIREKIFIPFFTTKSRGTGLGLSTAKRLVESHQGAIRIDCPPSGGTTVTIDLPLAQAHTAGTVLEST